MIAITIFIVAFVVFYGVISYAGMKPPVQELSDTGHLIIKTLSSTNASTVIVNNQLNADNFKEFSLMTLDEQKNYLGVTEDFCVYFEDENGRIIPIGGKVGAGSAEIKLGGEKCGSPVPNN